MKFKKNFMLPFIIMIFMLSACNGNSKTEQPVLAAEYITGEVLNEIAIPSAVAKDMKSLALYYDVDETMVSDMSMYICASGAFPDEITVFVLSDNSFSDDVLAAMKKRLDYQISLFKDYTPDEMYKLDNAVLKADGRYVYLIACENNARADEIIRGLIK